MPLMTVLITLIVVGVLLWMVNTYIPMDAKIKRILNVVAVIGVVLRVLRCVRLVQSSRNVRGRIAKPCDRGGSIALMVFAAAHARTRVRSTGSLQPGAFSTGGDSTVTAGSDNLARHQMCPEPAPTRCRLVVRGSRPCSFPAASSRCPWWVWAESCATPCSISRTADESRSRHSPRARRSPPCSASRFSDSVTGPAWAARWNSIRHPQAGIMPKLNVRYAATTFLGQQHPTGCIARPSGRAVWLRLATPGSSTTALGTRVHGTVCPTMRCRTSSSAARSPGDGVADSAAAPPRVVFSAWGGPLSQVTRTGRDPHQVSYDERFPTLGAATLDQRVENLGSWRESVDRLALGPSPLEPRRACCVWGPTIRRADRAARPALESIRSAVHALLRSRPRQEPRSCVTRAPLRPKLWLADVDAGKGSGQILPSDMSRLGGRDGLAGLRPWAVPRSRSTGRPGSCTCSRSLAWPKSNCIPEWGAVYADVWNDAKPSKSLGIRSA